MINIDLFVFSSITIMIVLRWKVDDEEEGGPSAPPVEEDDDGEHYEDDGVLVHLR